MSKAIRAAVGSRLDWVRAIAGAPLAYRPGHYYSPITDPAEIARRYRDPRANPAPKALPGIQLRHDAQVALWDGLSAFLPDHRGLSRDDPARRYQEGKQNFGFGDAAIYAALLRHHRPKRIIEVGSGASSALVLDIIDTYLDGATTFTCIEPYPAYLYTQIRPEDRGRITILASPVQDVPLATFDELEAGDILFLDTTHIIKTSSDVLFDFFEIMPRLKPGVIVHIHDMFYPFEYIHHWVVNVNRSWNELYFVRAFLMYNDSWQIEFFNDYFITAEPDRVARVLPELLTHPGRAGGGLWLRRC